MGHRTIKRVPLDFEWPLNEIWQGYLMPDELDLPECPACGGEGYSPEANAIARTFYPHMIGGPHADQLAWCDKIGQAEVDYLIDQNRLRTWRDGGWHSEPRTAAEVNQSQRGTGLGGHDAINHGLLVRFRCERLGIPENCPTCQGKGTVATDAQEAAYEAWEPTEPPTGNGWQLWETTSEGSPVTPVFGSAEELAGWCEDNATWFAGLHWTRDQWLRSFLADTTDVDSLVAFRVQG